MCEFELVVGRKYKVCLKPFEELLALGLVEGSDVKHTWYREYLGSDVGVFMHLDDCQGVVVHWSDGSNYFYDLKELKILGEV